MRNSKVGLGDLKKQLGEATSEADKAKLQDFNSDRKADVVSRDTLFHTNTSTLSVTAIAAGSSLPGRVVGTHYCNPAPMMPLVEVVKGQDVREERKGPRVGAPEAA